MFLFGFRVTRRLGPHPTFEVELIPGRLEDFAAPRPRQEQQPNDIRRLLVGRSIERRDQPGDFIGRQIALALIFGKPIDALAGIYI